MRHPIVALVAALALTATAAQAVPPPARINYQGVLRAADGAPVDATHDMVFRFFDADIGGAELLVDTHAGADAVVVSGGLFNVALGGGDVADGSGPGTHTALETLFRDEPTVWMQVEVAGEVLLPRVEVMASAYAMMSMNAAFAAESASAENSTRLGGQTAGAYVRSNADDTVQGRLLFTGGSTGNQTLGGLLALQPTGVTGLDTIVGIEVDGEPRLTFNALGTMTTKSLDWGIYARGNSGGGYFRDLDDSGYAFVGLGNRGIEAHGDGGGGYFSDTNGTGTASVGTGNTGAEGGGSYAGGFFYDTDSSGYAYVATGDTGVRGSGNSTGGFFTDIDSSGAAYAGYGDYGIWASGSYTGAYFEDSNSTGRAFLGYSNYGVRGYGTSVGGLFADDNGSGYAWVGHNDYGIDAYGNAGAYFRELDTSTYAWLAEGSIGVSGEGESQGGYFRDIDAGTYVRTGFSTASIFGNGSKNFVQNHPHDRSKTIVYTALEGDEAATYTRGTARLVDGRAVVRLGETFRWVTNPDLGLTAHLTPRGANPGLYVESLSTTELVVAGDPGSDAAFDYVVFGLRVGFESAAVVREKDLDAYLPSMEDHARMFERDPSLLRHTPLERFKAMEATVRGIDRDAIDLSAGQALADAVGRFDPAVHRQRDADRPDAAESPLPPGRPGAESGGAAAAGATDLSPVLVDAAPGGRATTAIASDAPRPASEPGVADRVEVSEAVEPGDVLTIDPERPGRLRRAASMADPGVVGVVAARETADERFGPEAPAPLASAGVVEVKVDAGYGAIRPGDLLTASPTAGHAMRAMETRPGTVLGKALDGLDAGTGTVRVVLALR